MASARLRGTRWTALYRAADGKQKSAGTYDTEEEALARATVAELDARPAGLPVEVEVYALSVKGKETLAAYVPKWIDAQMVEETSRENYKRVAARVVKHLGSKAREDICPDDVRKMLKALKRDGLRDSTIAATLTMARLILGEAACAGVTYRVKDRRERMVVTREQAKAIEDAITPRYRLLVRAAFATGCRWGELIAIRGTDVEQRGTGYVLKIRRTVIEVNAVRTERSCGRGLIGAQSQSARCPAPPVLVPSGSPGHRHG